LCTDKLLTTKVDTGTGGDADTSACGTVNTVVKAVDVKLDMNLLNTSAIIQRKTPFSFAHQRCPADKKSLIVI
jgi:hypothetical protein